MILPEGVASRAPRPRSVEAPGSRLAPETLCTIYVKALSGQKLCLKVRPGDTVLSLKQKIRDKDYIPVAQQRLIFNQQELIDGKRLYDSKVFDGATVHLVLLRA